MTAPEPPAVPPLYWDGCQFYADAGQGTRYVDAPYEGRYAVMYLTSSGHWAHQGNADELPEAVMRLNLPTDIAAGAVPDTGDACQACAGSGVEVHGGSSNPGSPDHYAPAEEPCTGCYGSGSRKYREGWDDALAGRGAGPAVPDTGQAREPDGHMRRLLAAEQDRAGNLRAAIRGFLGQDTFRDSDEDLIAAMSRAAYAARNPDLGTAADTGQASEPDGATLIAAERRRQVTAEGWTPEHDDEHRGEEMAIAAACYALPPASRARHEDGALRLWRLWPWLRSWWKPCPNDRVRELVKAGALIAAEIDRRLRAGASGDTVQAPAGPPAGFWDESGSTSPVIDWSPVQAPDVAALLQRLDEQEAQAERGGERGFAWLHTSEIRALLGTGTAGEKG